MKERCEEKHVDLLLIEEAKKHYVLIKDFCTFMYDHPLHRGRKNLCYYWLGNFSKEETEKRQNLKNIKEK